MNTMKRLTLTLVVALCLAVVAGTAGCRRDTGADGSDSTLVFNPDSTVGMWETDTLGSSLTGLEIHQQALRDVFFDYDSSDLDQEALDNLMYDAAYIMAHTGFKVLVEGHCDERGTIDYNLALGERRALAAYNYLVNYGIAPSRLQYVSYGKERPFVIGSDEYAWSQNRRAHFRVLPQ